MDITCEFCDDPLDTKKIGNYRRVVGWVQNRKQGGGNSITLSSEPTGWAHGTCIDILKSQGPISGSSDSLF